MKNDDLISRAAAIQIAERYGCNNGSVLGHHSGAADCVASEIATLPAVDAAPVVHAYWIEVDEGDGDYTYDCSVCGGKWWLAADTPEANGMKYCPYCGAKMDGRDSE